MLDNNVEKIQTREISRRGFLAATTAGMLGAGLGCAVRAASTPCLNVVVLVVDSLRADHLGCYGYRRSTSPVIDVLAKEGAVFGNAYSHSSFTLESVASLLTGVPPALNSFGTGWHAAPDPGRAHLGEAFSRAGYMTGFFSDTPVFADTPFGKGFSESEVLPVQWGSSGSSGALAARFAQFLEKRGANPFLAYVHFLDPHVPYEPAPEYQRRFTDTPFAHPMDLYRDVRPFVPQLLAEGFGPGDPRFEDIVLRYDAEIASTDAAIGAILKALQSRDALDNTLIVVTADHGEEFLEHGFVEHGWTLYEEVLRVPLIFWRPGLIAARQETGRACLCDLFPTLTTLSGVATGRTDLSGVALFDQHGASAAPRGPEEALFCHMLLETRLSLHAVICGGYKYLASPKWLSPAECAVRSAAHAALLADFKAGKTPPPPVWGPVVHEELYNLAVDPLEKKDLCGAEPETLARMRSVLDNYRKRCPAQYNQSPPSQETPGMSNEEKERLDFLGYL